MSNADTQRWLASTKAEELRDALNWRGIPGGGEGARLATQQGVRGSPIVDASCVPGLELYKVDPAAGDGIVQAGDSPTRFVHTGDYMWASAGNLDLSFVMWSNTNFGRSQVGSNWHLCCGIVLRGDTADEVRTADVFGSRPAQMVLTSGTHAWRVSFEVSSAEGDSSPVVRSGYYSDALVIVRPYHLPGNTTPLFNGWPSFPGTGGPYGIGSQFPETTPIPSLVYIFSSSSRLRPGAGADVVAGETELYNLMAANYATIRIYDFVLAATDLQPGQTQPIATMPPSASGVNTNLARTPTADDPDQFEDNPSYDYINDAIIAPRSPRRIAANPAWVSARSVAVNTTLTISDLGLSAFNATAGERFSVGVAPASAQIANASYAYNRTTGAFTFTATEAGTYRLAFTGALAAEPGKRAQVSLTITVTS